MKYTCCKIDKLINRIDLKTETPGYTNGVLEIFYSSDEELLTWSRKEVKEWTRANNKRMRRICKLLNEEKL